MKIKKLLLLSLTLGLTFPGAHLLAGGWMSRQEDEKRTITDAADNQENNNNAQEAEAKTDEIKMDPFSLPKDLQNTLLEMLWFDNNPEQLKHDIKALFESNKSLKKRFLDLTTVRAFGYNGIETGYNGGGVPILFHTFFNNKIREIGVIKSQTTTLLGRLATIPLLARLTHLVTSNVNMELTHELFLNAPNKQYHIQIKSPESSSISGCTLSANGSVAIAWVREASNDRAKHISIFTIDTIKNNNNLTLDSKAPNTFQVEGKPLMKSNHKTNMYWAHMYWAHYPLGMVFNISGNQLALIYLTAPVYPPNDVSFINEEPKEKIEIDIIDNQMHNKALTPEQTAKRFMLPITALKEQLKQQRKTNHQEKNDHDQ